MMTRSKLLKEIAKLMDSYESSNDNQPVGCYLDFLPRDHGIYEWDGEKFVYTRGLKMMKKVV